MSFSRASNRPRALRHALGDRGPLVGADDQGHRTQRPHPLGLLAVDAVRDAGVADMPGGQGEARAQFAFAVFGEIAEEIQPNRPRPSGGVEQLVRNAWKRPIARQPRRQPRPRRTGEVGGPLAPGWVSAHAGSVRRSRVRGNSGEIGGGARLDRPRGVAVRDEARLAAGLGLVGVDRVGIMAAAAGVGDVIDAAAERAAGVAVDDVEGQGRVDRSGSGCRPLAQLPGLVANPGDRLHRDAGRGHRQGPAVAGDQRGGRG